MWGIELRYKAEVSLARQIFLSLKQRILAGEISQGEALPSTRELAKGLGASRNTVCEAYDMLLTEGFIVSHQGAPSRVAAGLHLTTKKNPFLRQRSKSRHLSCGTSKQVSPTYPNFLVSSGANWYMLPPIP